ncbi:Mite allergen Der f 3 [Cladobotryum mycophilum]|uniref:Mite allergen Der f 3 n=1 Tax=Cladobotryum mycophilum TaxID=491253 RepID=A0ABR0T196_9HYPO
MIISSLHQVATFVIVASAFFQTADAIGDIVGGKDAQPGQFPSVVSLQSIDGGHFCTGTVFNDTTILTAAHCIRPDIHLTSVVVYGTVTPMTDGLRLSITSASQHPDYDPETDFNDRGFVYIKNTTPLRRTSFRFESVKASESLIVAGWGFTHHRRRDLPHNLQYAEVESISNEDCSLVWGKDGIAATDLCTKPTENAGFCAGDSGGPLFDKEGRQIDGHHFCSGTIIRPNVILTTAHCIDVAARLLDSVAVVYGTTNVKVGGKRAKAVWATKHENYGSPRPFPNGIGLIFRGNGRHVNGDTA